MATTRDLPKDNLITPQGYQKLVDELEHLFGTLRPQIVEEVAAAAAQGDRSENAEYIYGKKRLREIDKRMQFLKGRVDRAKVIKPSLQKGDVVLFGATVTTQDENGVEKVYSIVGEDEADPSQGRISWKSPVGHALLNRRSGEYVEARTPRGTAELLITQVVFVDI